MNHKSLFYFDIETITEFEKWTDLADANPRKAKNFESRFNRRKETSMKQADVNSAYEQNAMFFPEYGRVVTFSYGFYNQDTLVIKSISVDSTDFASEEKAINEIFTTLQKVASLGLKPCGQNIKGFDIPFLNKKFLQYGLKIPKVFQSLNKKPWEVDIVDTIDLWKGLGWDATSLDEISETLGLFSPKDDIDGSQVGKVFWDDGDIKRIETYCEKDVKILPEIVERIYNANK